MTWFKVGDELTFHPRALRAGNAAMGLWLRAGTWCSEHLTDGWLSHTDARALGSAAEIKKLVAVGLWEQHAQDDEPGYRFHRWAEDAQGNRRQPTRAEVLEKRRLDRERKASAGRKGAGVRWDSGRIPDGIRVDSERLPMAPDPTRPVPEDTPPASQASGTRERRTTIPDDWAPTDAHRRYAHEHHLDLDIEARKFEDNARMNGRLGIDWAAGFRNWLVKSAEFAAARGGQKMTRDERAADILERGRRLAQGQQKEIER